MSDTWDLYGNAVSTGEVLGEVNHGTIVYTHGEDECSGEFCALHNPSDHPLKDAPMVFRMDRQGLIERTCEHGVGHPDPDSVSHFKRNGDLEQGVHGCDGCCSPPR